MEQGGVIQPQLHLAGGERGPAGIFGFAEPDIFRDKTADEPQAHPRKSQFHAAFVQCGDETGFQKIRQADEVEPPEAQQRHQREKPYREPQAAEGGAAFMPESRHIMGRSPE